ncbi:hypothetical protein ANO11243_090930 [Dothideomycetidae sp. 11243]|nr:hypothetical protein ANO11243_090930 [fungal sp. No.11243]
MKTPLTLCLAALLATVTAFPTATGSDALQDAQRERQGLTRRDDPPPPPPSPGGPPPGGPPPPPPPPPAPLTPEQQVQKTAADLQAYNARVIAAQTKLQDIDKANLAKATALVPGSDAALREVTVTAGSVVVTPPR